MTRAVLLSWTLPRWKNDAVVAEGIIESPPELVEVPPSMEKGWRVGEDNVIGGGEANDMGKQGSRSFAHADLVWVVVGVDVPPIIGRGWEGMASSAGLGA